MALRQELRARLTGGGGDDPIFLADLTRWYQRMALLGMMPPALEGLALPEVYRALGLPIWMVARLWSESLPGMEVSLEEDEFQRTRRVETASGPLIWQWERAPRTEWQQTHLPIAGPADLPAAVLWARAMRWELDTTGLTELDASIGSDGLLAIELPPRPIMRLGRELIGWDRLEELLEEPAMGMILAALDEPLQEAATALAQLAGSLQSSPDGLTSATVTAPFFDRYLAPSYRSTTCELREYHKVLQVSVHGDCADLAAPALEAGIATLAGVAPAEAGPSLGRRSAQLGEGITLWGGIDGGWLSPTVPVTSFEDGVRRAAADAAGHRGIVLGLAGTLPSDMDLDRLRAIPELIRSI
ncbi:MAG: hypothetical protein ACOX2L_01830 [Anaerolineae bacterium]|jgi:hypothetical protein|nr:hypothetical protein [Chloroflexota bacterium]